MLTSYWAEYGNASPLPRAVSAPGAVDCKAVPGALCNGSNFLMNCQQSAGRQLDHLHRGQQRARVPVVSARLPRSGIALAGWQRSEVGDQPRGHLGEGGRAVIELPRGGLCRQRDGDPPVWGGQHAHLPYQIATRR